MLTHYQSSKGPVAIDGMPLRYAGNALAKLRRDEPGRSEEIEALAAHCAKLEADAAAEAENPRAVIGGNNPPVETPADEPALTGWDAIKLNLDDLLVEAGNWADGFDIENQDQADAVSRLRQQLQQGASAADAARVAEKQPLDEQIAEIQERYNAYIAPMKNRQPGSVSKAVTALGNLLTSWLTKLDDERRAREKAAADAAAKAAAEALAAHADAKDGTDLAAMDRAEDKLAEAETLIKQAKGVASEKVQAKGEFRATGLRSYWIAEMRPGGGSDALRHYLAAKPERLKALLQSLADEDVRNGARSIPGFDIIEQRKVA